MRDGWFAKKPPNESSPLPPGKGWQQEPPAFDPVPPPPAPVGEIAGDTAAIASRSSAVEEQRGEPADLLDVYPPTYAAVRAVEDGRSVACLFVPADGKAFGRDYACRAGIDWLNEGTEGFEVTYGDHAVIVRGRNLWPVFMALHEQRAYRLQAFSEEHWNRPPVGDPLVTHIVRKVEQPPARKAKGNDM